jgi:phosphatidylserine decarboxylase
MITLVLSVTAAIALVIVLFLVQFYRNPERAIPAGGSIVSPADGRIISILRTTDKKVAIEKGAFGKIRALASDVGRDCYVISIFMSPIDAHYNRAPIAGKITSIIHQNGKLLPVHTMENGLQNENNQIIIENKKMKVKVIQIAGFVARRIRCFVKESQFVKKGERIGMICLGSQATLIMPAKVKLVVKEGQHVKAGSSVIAEIS